MYHKSKYIGDRQHIHIPIAEYILNGVTFTQKMKKKQTKRIPTKKIYYQFKKMNR